jgi:hypothetical protein
MLPIGSSSRWWLSQATHSSVANSTLSVVFQRTLVDHFGVVEPVDRFRERVVVCITGAAHGRLDASFGKPLRVANTDVLRSAVRVVNQAAVVAGLALVKRLLQCIENEVSPHVDDTRQPTMRRAKTSITKAT